MILAVEREVISGAIPPTAQYQTFRSCARHGLVYLIMFKSDIKIADDLCIMLSTYILFLGFMVDNYVIVRFVSAQSTILTKKI